MSSEQPVQSNKMKPVRTTRELCERIASDPELAAKIKENPEATLAGLATPLENDVWIYRMVVISLGASILVSISGAIVLAGFGRPTPELLVAVASAAVGALAGLLAPAPTP